MRFWTLFHAIVVASLLLPAAARGAGQGGAPPPPPEAQNKPNQGLHVGARHVDILATGRAFCREAGSAAPAGMKCEAWKNVASSGFRPPGALKGSVGGADPCTLVSSLEGTTGLSGGAAGARTALLSACHEPRELEGVQASGGGGALEPATMIAVTALQGLGDYLQSLAKEELVDFAVEKFAKGFCKSGGALGGQKLFPTACPLLFPKGYDQPPDTGVVLNGQFVEAVKNDALAIPGVLVGGLPMPSTMKDGPALRAELVVLASDLTRLAAKQDEPVLVFLENLRDHVRNDASASKLECVFTAASSPPEAACALALVLEVVGDANHELASDGRAIVPPGVPSIEHWLDDASVKFCQTYGAHDSSGQRPKDGGCVFGADAELWGSLQRVTASVALFYERIARIGPTLDQAVKMARFKSEVEPAMLADTATAIGGLAADILTTADGIARRQQMDIERRRATMPEGAERAALTAQLDPFRSVYEVMVVAEDAMAFVAVVVQKDVSAAVVKLQKVLADPLVARNLDERFARAATFVLTLAQAKDRAEAERVIQDAAAPRGTFRAKYDTDTVMINGYLAIFGVARVAATAERTSPGFDGLGSPFIQPLSAPVGVEWSFAHCVFDGAHCGISVIALDPLALRVINNASGPVEADFDGVLDPGVLLHMGIARSPFDVMLGATVQPLLKSSARGCGAPGEDRPCWQAPVNFMIGVSIDAPILQLE